MDNKNGKINLEKTTKFFFCCLKRLGVFHQFMDEYCRTHEIDKSIFVWLLTKRIVMFCKNGRRCLPLYGDTIHPCHLLTYSDISFVWEETQKGFDHWSNVCDDLNKFRPEGQRIVFYLDKCTIMLSKYIKY